MPPSNFEIPIINNSSPFTTEEEKRRDEEKEAKKNWIGDKNFKKFFGKASTGLKKGNFIPNYVTMTPSEPALLHKFRKDERKKWVVENGWKC